jgi:hypothetical protein
MQTYMLYEAKCERDVDGILGLTAQWEMKAVVNCPTLARGARQHSQFYRSLP